MAQSKRCHTWKRPKPLDEIQFTTGIPQGEQMEAPAEAPTATVVKTEQERAVHPDYNGKEYDELHGTVKKNIEIFLREWAKQKNS